MILLAGVGEVGAVILRGHKVARGKEAALAMANVLATAEEDHVPVLRYCVDLHTFLQW